MIEALGLLEQALAIDAHYGPALAWAATCHLRLVRDGWSKEPGTDQRKAVDFARRALQAARNDPRVLANTALVLARFGEDIGAMIGLIDRALALNPSFARGWYHSGVLRIAAGEPDLTMEHIETALRLSPREQFGTPLAHMGQVYFFKHRFDVAAATLLQAIHDNPGSPEAYRFLAACYAHMGRIDDARAIIARLSTVTSLILPRVLYYRNPEYRDLLLSGLRLAMGEAE